jgi:hypothetical protein
MKINFLFVLSLTIFSFSSCDNGVKGENGVIYKSALQYSDYIVERQTSIAKNIIEYAKAIDINLDSASRVLDKTIAKTDISINELKRMPPYNGDRSFRDAAIDLFEFYKKIFSTDYRRIIEIRKKNDAITESDKAEVKEIVNSLSKEERRFDSTMHIAQENFGLKNKLTLKENDLQKSINKMNK